MTAQAKTPEIKTLVGLAREVLAQPHLARLAKVCTATIALSDGETTLPLLEVGATERIRLAAPAAIWAQVFGKLPAPGYQSIGALRRTCADFAVEGSELAYMQTLPLLEALFEAMREALHGTRADAHPDDQPDDLAGLRGRYLRLGASASSDSQWVFEESAGNPDQPPLVMLHTAGADARQWHGLMCSAELQADWHLLAFDLPGHGRSPLPPGEPNWNWCLTESAYVAWVIAYLKARGISKSVLMGCSMGSAVALPLLARYPDLFAGAVLLETPYRSPGRRSQYLDHPAVHGNRLGAIWVGSLMSPASPASRRRQATWIYSQGAPSVYDGDLAFYSDEFEASRHTGTIDTARTPLWLLTGEYDYSASPAETAKVAKEIPGAQFSTLEGFGHFPMTEDPHRLLPSLREPLRALRRKFPISREAP